MKPTKGVKLQKMAAKTKVGVDLATISDQDFENLKKILPKESEKLEKDRKAISAQRHSNLLRQVNGAISTLIKTEEELKALVGVSVNGNLQDVKGAIEEFAKTNDIKL